MLQITLLMIQITLLRITDKYIPMIIEQVHGIFTNSLTKDYLIKNDSSIHLDSFVFRVNTTERYRLVGSLGAWKMRSNKKLPKITYELDSEILREGERSVSIITTRLLTPGIHRYNSWITGIKNER